MLDPEVPTYALDVVSVVEATLEDPRPVLGAQEHKARGEAVGEMKADGIEYDERMELLDEVSWPKPLQELLEHTYEVYRRSHPWVAEDALSPKSVVRDMYERAMTFAEYVAFYGLTRSEGLVLRYLGDAYRALRQTVPDSVRTDDLDDIVEWLGRRRAADRLEPARRVGAAQRPRSVAGQPPTSTPPRAGEHHRQRARVHRAGPQRDVPPRRAGRADRWQQLGELEAEAGSTMTAEDWREALEAYFDEHDAIDTGPDARGPRMLLVEKAAARWEVQQIVGDPEGNHDWRITATVDLDASDARGRAGPGRHGARPALIRRVWRRESAARRLAAREALRRLRAPAEPATPGQRLPRRQSAGSASSRRQSRRVSVVFAPPESPGQTKALSPVIARPTIRVLISRVPS